MHSVLESAVRKINIILFQELWIESENITVLYSVFTSIISVTKLRSRVVIFILKTNHSLKYTLRSDILTDSDL